MARTPKQKAATDFDSISFISLASIPEIRRNNYNFQLICYTVAIIIVLISLVLSLTLPFLFKYANDGSKLPSNQACIPCGIVEGLDRDGIVEFLGIPYAHPPNGVYKLEPPQELIHASFCRETSMNNSKTIYQAKAYKPACLQYLPGTNEINPFSSEDCLYLNVYTPETFPKRFRPVIVIINGLFHQYGSANMPFFTVTPNLVKVVDAVHVTFNYRMGPMSFTVSNGTNLTNFGLLDQIALLKWVKNNIKKFGGDPENIILYGLGSGATYSLSHLTSENSKLFHKMWVSSPGLIVDRHLNKLDKDTFQDSRIDSESLLKLCQWNDCTSQIIDLLELTQKANPKYLSKVASLPIIDGKVIRKDYWKLLGAQKKNIPIVIGINSNDAGILPRPQTLRLWYRDEYEFYAKYNVKNADFLKLYSPLVNITLESQYTSAVTDLRFTCPIIQLGNQLLQDNRNQLLYIYQLTGKHDFVDLFGLKFASDLSVHGWDSALYFGSYNIDQLKLNLDSLLKATGKMRSFMKEFAWSKTISEFQHWNKQDLSVNIIEEDGKTAPRRYFKQSECELWSDNLESTVWRG